jgi:hypothetical protein
MWPSESGRSSVDHCLIAVLSALIFLLVASSIVSVAAAKVPHQRARMAVPKQPPAAAQDPATAGELKQQSEVLVGLQVSQSALEKETADFNTAIQRRMNQLIAQFGDSQKQTHQMLEETNQRINSTQRWLKAFATLFVLSLGGLLYVALQLSSLQDNPIKWKGKVPEISPAEEDTIAWQSGEPAKTVQPVSWIIKPDTHLPSSSR